MQAICTPAPPAQSTACRPPLHPLSPIAPAFDGGIPGPCTETAFNGTAQQDESWTYDSAGNVLTDTQTQGTNLSRLTNIWDPCGRNVYSERRSLDGGLLSATETDFGPDGLLLRTVNTSRWCEQQFGYLLDDAGQVVTVYDPVACTLIERIERDAGVLAAIRPDGQTNWNLLPDGGVLRVRDSNVYGFWSERVWDEQGRPLSESGTGNATSITYIAAWSWDGGQLLRYAGGSQGNGCGSDSWFSEAFVYDGGTLVHEDLAHSGPPCQWGYYNPAWTMDYSSPSDGVQLAQITVDGGVTQLRKTVFDERGNALSVAQAFAPDFTWEPQLRRTYGCFRAK